MHPYIAVSVTTNVVISCAAYLLPNTLVLRCWRGTGCAVPARCKNLLPKDDPSCTVIGAARHGRSLTVSETVEQPLRSSSVMTGKISGPAAQASKHVALGCSQNSTPALGQAAG